MNKGDEGQRKLEDSGSGGELLPTVEGCSLEKNRTE